MARAQKPKPQISQATANRPHGKLSLIGRLLRRLLAIFKAPAIGGGFSFARRGTDELGRLGERLAGRHLRAMKMKILARNYRCPAGECDLIAIERHQGQETIVFVEVKTRSSEFFVAAESAVDHRKQQRLRRIASYYLASRSCSLPCRFDIVSVVCQADQQPLIRHIENAF